MNDQLQSFFDCILSKLLSAFRKNYSCQSVLLKMISDWKKALDNGKTIGVVMIDLSKAFDTIPHPHLLSKLENYGLSKDAVSLMRSYLSNRYQRVKIGNSYSDWSSVKCGVPQGSILDLSYSTSSLTICSTLLKIVIYTTMQMITLWATAMIISMLLSIM